MIPADHIEEAVAWRRHLHAHPELCFEERETARFVAERLSGWGLAVRTGYGGTGLVGTLSRGTSRRAIALRADMDALPLTEETGLTHRSTAPGRMHACGHDGHVAMLLAAARACASSTSLDGTVHFVFQPAEENGGGAARMIEDGLFRDFPVECVHALHNWPGLAVGDFAARDGAMMAASAFFEVEVEGRGAHGAMPHEGADPIPATCAVVSALQTIASRNVSPLRSAVVSVTQIHAGEAWNVIPERCVVRGTARWFDAGVGETIATRLAGVAGSVSAGYGCVGRTRLDPSYPATVNHPPAAALARSVAGSSGTDLRVVDVDPSMAAEDFSYMLEATPGCYAWLGAGRGGDTPGLHSPRFDFNDDVLPLGAGYWVALVRRSLGADPR